jgi:hypothetical protein
MSRKQFSDIINKEKEKTGIIMGLGPSLRDYINSIKNLEQNKDRFSIISCNNIDVMSEVIIDYWILAQPTDYQNPLHIPLAKDRYNKMGATFLYTDCLDLTPRDQVDELLSGIDYIGYDQRHFNSEKCGWLDVHGRPPSCCNGIIQGRLCIQEEFQKYTGYDVRYGSGDTVGVHMVSLGVMLGLNPIYITGIDLDYTNGYFNNDFEGEEGTKRLGMRLEERIKMGMDNINRVPDLVDRIVKDMNIINESAKKIGVKIYNTSKKSRLNEVFEYKDLNELS